LKLRGKSKRAQKRTKKMDPKNRSLQAQKEMWCGEGGQSKKG